MDCFLQLLTFQDLWSGEHCVGMVACQCLAMLFYGGRTVVMFAGDSTFACVAGRSNGLQSLKLI